MLKSMFVVGQLLLIACFVVFFMRLAVGRNALRATGNVWRELPRRPVFRMAVVIWLSVFLFDLAQTYADDLFMLSPSEAYHADYTRLIFQYEGFLVAALQQLLHWKPLTYLLALAYYILFPALLFGSAHAYDRLDDHPRLKMTAYVFALNYILCLPFYLFFPVTEVWSLSEARVLALSDEISPLLLTILRPMSGLDNCFPSYHASLTISLVLVAWSGAPRRFRHAAAVAGALILLSTVYLGIHWVFDVVTGGLAGCFVYLVARRVVEADVPVAVTVDSRTTSHR